MKRLFFLFLCITLISKAIGQEFDLAAEEVELERLLIDLRSSKNNQEKKEKNALLKAEMSRVLQSKEAMLYPFLKLTTIGFIDSPDKQMRIINWNVEQDDLSQEYTAFVIHLDKRGQVQYVTELEDNSSGIPVQTNEFITADNWYGALYYKVIPVKKGSKTIYTLLGWDYNTSLSQIKIIDAIYFNGKNVKLGSPIFKSGNTTEKRVFFEYSKKVTMSLKYEEDRERIIFDHLSPESPSMNEFRTFYVPDMSYDGFKLKKGKWVLHEDIIGVNKGSNQKKQYIYVQNEKTGKVQGKEVKVEWLNPEDSGNPANGGHHVAVTPDVEIKGEEKNDVRLPKINKRDRRDPSELSVYGNEKKKKRRFKRRRN
ncbi:MAG: hypothetical protein QNK85_07700 [Crocinitomicaceae bacterium]